MRKLAFLFPLALVAAVPAQAAVAALDVTGVQSSRTGVSPGQTPQAPAAGSPAPRQSTPLPDPNALTLLSLGLAGLIFGRRIAARRQVD